MITIVSRKKSHPFTAASGDTPPEVLRHRLVLTYEGIAGGVSPETIVTSLLERYPPPRIDLGDRIAR